MALFADPDRGFQIGYPRDWILVPDDQLRVQAAGDEPGAVSLDSVGFVAASADGAAIEAVTYLPLIPQDNGSLDAVVDRILAASGESVAGFDGAVTEPFRLDDRDAIRIRYTVPSPSADVGPRAVRQVVTLEGDEAVLLTIVVAEDQAEDFASTADRIESSWLWETAAVPTEAA